jgi:Fe-S cluster assembly protein SufD
VSDGAHLDQQLVVEHRAGATRSRQRFHGIGAGKGTAVFNGRIHIHPGAPGADAALSNRNLALHPDAVIDTKPELEIYTDDVKCSHGATVGRLSEESLFYLCSRGLDPRQARRILCRAFIRECVTGALAEAAEAELLGDWLEAQA